MREIEWLEITDWKEVLWEKKCKKGAHTQMGVLESHRAKEWFA